MLLRIMPQRKEKEVTKIMKVALGETEKMREQRGDARGSDSSKNKGAFS